MGIVEIFAVAIALAMDALAVSVMAGIRQAPLTRRQIFRLSFHFGLFQFMMPVIGAAVGEGLALYISSFGRWIAFGLLTIIGVKMIYEALKSEKNENRGDLTRGWTLIGLAVATSIDALAVGLSIAILKQSVLVPAIIIGLVCAAISILGAKFGSRIGDRYSHWAEITGGIILIAIGIKTAMF